MGQFSYSQNMQEMQEFEYIQNTYLDILLSTSLHLDKKVIWTSRVNSPSLISSYLSTFQKKRTEDPRVGQGP